MRKCASGTPRSGAQTLMGPAALTLVRSPQVRAMYARVHTRLLGALALRYVDGSGFSLLETHRLMGACWHAVRLCPRCWQQPLRCVKSSALVAPVPALL